MPTPVRSNSGRKRVARISPHQMTDVAGVILLGAAIVMTFALAAADAGVLGQALSGFFIMVFGRGAWAVPILLAFLGLSLLFGRTKYDVGRVGAGATLLFLAGVGQLGARNQGDLFDPERVLSNGGYVGAIVAWCMQLLLGQARAVGIVILALVGVILCLDRPLRSFIEGIRFPKVSAAKAPKPERVAKRLPEMEDDVEIDRAARREKLRESLINVGSAVVDSSPIQAPKTEAPAPPKKQPSLPTLDGTPPAFSHGHTNKEGYDLPELSMLNEAAGKPKRTADEMRRNIETLEGTLEQFGIDANVVEVAAGPSITRYEIQLGPGVRVNRITSLADNIAMDLAASHVRVEAPIPGKAAIGVEVPNSQPSMVTLREVCETKEFMDHPSRLFVALGQDVSGVNRYCDLTKMPHLLIAGATNSGKSIGLATVITSLLMRNTPKEVRMVMIDPKRVELSLFDGIPHLMCPVVKDVQEAPGVLRAVWREMDSRYDRFSEIGVRNIDGWNEKADFQDRLPYIVVVIDELADLMIQAAAEVETSIVRLAQLARAVGIHLVIATQRPSADVITGTIKTNIPSRIAFAVASQIDSRIILDQSGAERLVGKGDMLYLPIDASKPLRIQGCYVSEKEIDRVCKHWRAQGKPQYLLNPIETAIRDREAALHEQSESDPLWEESVRWVVDRNQASTSMLQRRFSIGFQRASRLLDMMEERGIVGPRDGAKPRAILLDPMQVEAMFGRTYVDQDITIDPLE